MLILLEYFQDIYGHCYSEKRIFTIGVALCKQLYKAEHKNESKFIMNSIFTSEKIEGGIKYP
jgi:hypothetical protein